MPKLLKNQIQIPAVLPNAFLRLTAILTKKNSLEKKNSTFCHTQKFKQKSIKNTDHQSVEMNQNLTFLFKGHSSVKKYFYCCAKRCFVKTP